MMPWTGQYLDVRSQPPGRDAGAALGSTSTLGRARGGGQLAAYRDAVADLADEIAGRARADRMTAGAILAGRLAEPQFSVVLSATPGGMAGARDRLLPAAGGDLSGGGNGGACPAALIRIHLLAQIDAMWWGHLPAFVTDADVLGSAELVDLGALRRRGLLGFRYRRQARTLVARAIRAADRRAWPGRVPRTAGMRFTRARPEAVALLNQLSVSLAASRPPGAPPLWVTSLARSVEHQHRLRALGYAATLPSAHCTGYAIDVEMAWYRRSGERDVSRELQSLLFERQDRGDINVIDEGQTWHVCISPLAAAALRRHFYAETAG